MNAIVNSKKYQLPFHSKLLEWLENVPQQVAPYQQWNGMLKNQQGIRKEEIECSGLLSVIPDSSPDEEYWLIPEKDRPTKADLINEAESGLLRCALTVESHWSKAYCPSLGVKTITNSFPKNVDAKAKPFVDRAQTLYQHPSLGYWIIRTAYEDLMTSSPNWIILDPNGKFVTSHEKHKGWFPTAVEAFDEMHRITKLRFAAFGQEKPYTLYDQYTFMGGNDYQEWFVRLPNWPLTYKDTHFQMKQLLIHIRTTERIDYDGCPFLMVEEIQSPWHNSIRDNGSYLDESEITEPEQVAFAPFSKEWHELAIKTIIWLAVLKGHEHIGFTTGKQQCQRWGNLEGLMNLYDSDIPKCLNKVAAKFDCANDWATIITRKPDGVIHYEKPNGWIVKDKNNKPLTALLKNKDVALFFLNERSTPVKEKVRLLQISPALKKAVNANQIPLFGW